MSSSDDLKDEFLNNFEAIWSFVESGDNIPKDRDIICSLCTVLFNYKHTEFSKIAASNNVHFKSLIKRARPWEQRYRSLLKCKDQTRLVLADILKKNT